MIELGESIKEYFGKHFSDDFVNKYREYIGSENNTFIRVNRLEITPEELQKRLTRFDIELEQVPGLEYSFKVLKGQDIVGKAIEHLLGYYYMQSLSSMIPPLVLQPTEDDKVLDLCAAPGSKTTQMAEMMLNKGTLYANEAAVARVKALVHNTSKMSFTNIGVMQSRGEQLSKFFDNHFDKILVDAPCSALGIIQKKGEVSNWWNYRLAQKLSEMQLKLFVSAIKMLKEGGELLYSTCTLTYEENELTLNKILQNYPVELVDIELPVKSHPAYTSFMGEKLHPSIEKAHRIIPWEIGSEGFFVAKLRKTGTTPSNRGGVSRYRNLEMLSFNNRKINKYLVEIADRYGIPEDVLKGYKYFWKANEVYFVNADWDEAHLGNFEKIGQKFGMIDKKDYLHIKTHAAKILGPHFKNSVVELTEKEDLETYFNGQNIRKDFGVYGKVIVKYNGKVVGTGVQSESSLKSQFPRLIRTHEKII